MLKMKVKRVVLSLIAMILVMTVMVPVYAEEQDKDVENPAYIVTVEAGLDGILMEGKPAPISITIRNLDKDFDGTLRVIIPATYDQDSLAYEKAITVPYSGEKTFSMLLPDIRDAKYLRIELETGKKKIIYSQRETIRPVSAGQEAIIGVLSSDYTGLNYFDGTTISMTYGIVSAKLVQLTADNLPEVSDGLEICDMILIDNYNTSQLSEEQRSAIIGWVNNGGILMLATGSKASVVLEGFVDTLCPVQTGGLTKNTISVNSFGSYEVSGVDCAEITAQGWSDLQSVVAYGAPIYQQTYGGGTVNIISYDLAMNPIAGWTEGRDSLASSLLSNVGTDSQYQDIVYNSEQKYDDYNMNNAVAGVDLNKVPNALLYSAIYLIYVIILGPVAYLVLKAKDKREKIWLVMPAITLVFTIIILFTSMAYKIRKPFIDEVSIVEYSNGSTSTKVFMYVRSPKGKAYDIDLAAPYKQVSSWANDGYDSYGTTDYGFAIVEQPENLKIRMSQGIAFTKKGLYTEKQEYSQGSGFDYNLTCTLNGFSGEVTNHTGHDLTNAVICYNGNYIFIGHFANNETVTLDANAMNSMYSISWDMRQWMEKTTNDIDFFMDQEEKVQLRANKNLYETMEECVNNLEMNQGCVFGIIDDYSPDLIDGNKTKVYSIGMAVSYFHQVVEEYQNYTIFIDDINSYMVGGSGLPYEDYYPEGFDYFYDLDDLDMYGSAEMEVLYDFGSVDLTSARLFLRNTGDQSDDISMDDPYSPYAVYDTFDYRNYASVQLYNYETGAYEDVFANGEEVSDLKKYLNEYGWMQIRYYVDDYDGWGYYAPNISLVGGEQ